jgi:4-oxalocrotonate tautomerase
MPLTRVSLLKGKQLETRRAILDGLYQAMREVFDVPEDDRFMTIDEYDKGNFLYGENYLFRDVPAKNGISATMKFAFETRS